MITVNPVGTVRVAIVESTVVVPTVQTSWHCKCLTCGWQSKRLVKHDAAVRLGNAHRCTRWGST